MDSLPWITQEEAEKLVKMPTSDQASLLKVTVRSPFVTLGAGTPFRVVENATFDPEIHGKLATLAGMHAIKCRIKREHLALMLNTSTGLLMAMAPMVDPTDGRQKPNTWRPVNREIVDQAYDPVTRIHIAAALSCGNIKTVDGVRRFIFPSVCLVPKEPSVAKLARAAGKTASTVLGATATTAAALRKAFTADEAMQMFFKLEKNRVGDVLSACHGILEACRTDKPELVPGAFLGPMDNAGSHAAQLPPDYMTPVDKTSKQPSERDQQLDLTNHAFAGCALAYFNKFTVTPDKEADAVAPSTAKDTVMSTAADELEEISSGKIESAILPDSASPPVSELSSSSSCVEMSLKSAKPSAAAKRKTTAVVDAPAVVPDAKRTETNGAIAAVREVADLEHAVREKLPIMVDGFLSERVHAAVFGDNVPMQGAWHNGTNLNSPDKAPLAVVAGMYASNVFNDPNIARRAGLLEYISAVTRDGSNALTADAREKFGSMTMAALLDVKADTGVPITLVSRGMAVLGVQFLAGLLHGHASTQLNTSVYAIAADLLQPLVSDANAARAETSTRLEEANARIAEHEKQLEAARATIKELETALDEKTVALALDAAKASEKAAAEKAAAKAAAKTAAVEKAAAEKAAAEKAAAEKAAAEAAAKKPNVLEEVDDELW